MRGRLWTAAAALSMVMAGSAAAAQPAAPASLAASARVGESTEGAGQASDTTIVLAVLLIAALLGTIVLAFHDDPDSP